MTILQVQHNNYALRLKFITPERYEEIATDWNNSDLPETQTVIPTKCDNSFVKTISMGNKWTNYYTPVVGGDIVGLLEDLDPQWFSIFYCGKEHYNTKELIHFLNGKGLGIDEENIRVKRLNISEQP